MKFRPLHDRVVIRRVDAEVKTAGGIIIPDNAQEKPMMGEVVAAGAGRRNKLGMLEPIAVAVGDRVLFGKWSGTEVTIDGADLLVMAESDILGIVQAPAAAPSAPSAAPPPASPRAKPAARSKA